MKTLSFLALALSAATAAHAAETAGRPKAVIELFTSQGCSSCPPADKLLGELAKQPGYVVLSMPVTYWDYLGWRDTLASDAFTARQKAYGKVRGDRQVYTPQAVIDGASHAVGSELDSIQAATRTAPGDALSVPVTLARAGGQASVEVGAATGAIRSGEVWLLPIARKRTVAIGRGENSGSTVTYTNVVRDMVRLGDWIGAAVRYDLPAATLAAGGADGYVVLLQAGSDKRPGTILGAVQSPALSN